MPATVDCAQAPPLIRALLADQACFDHAVEPVKLIETHISWVLLTGEFAYKIKKPVDLGFLDFSTLEKRKHACEDEVRLNRRLAPEIYLGVAAITGSPESPHLDGQGSVIEYAVKMRQFSPAATLDRLSERGGLGIQQIDALAVRLAKFHLDECDTAAEGSSYGEPDSILKPVADNFRMLSERLKNSGQLQRLAQLHSWSLAEHQRLTPQMRERRQQGRVRECHGDLHLGNLAWSDGQLIIFDCIEFSAELRWIDVMSEVAFCYMDLLHRNHRGLAFRFLNAWLESSGDYRGMALLRYYAVYRAMVRAKVAALRAEQTARVAAEVEECLLLAEQLITHAPPRLWITHGLSGCGKTTLSQALLQEQGMVRLRSDVERKRLAGLAANASSGSGLETGLYTPEASRKTYAHLASLAKSLLESGWPVIVDASFLARWQRDLFRELALQQGAGFRILDIRADHAILRDRLVRRAAQGGEASEADLDVLDHQIETQEVLGLDELVDTMQVSAGNL